VIDDGVGLGGEEAGAAQSLKGAQRARCRAPEHRGAPLRWKSLWVEAKATSHASNAELSATEHAVAWVVMLYTPVSIASGVLLTTPDRRTLAQVKLMHARDAGWHRGRAPPLASARISGCQL
jgi:hypothetical protein